MYLGGLSGVKEWEGWNGPITQAAVDKRWAEIGQQPPAPIVPAELLGVEIVPSRGLRLFRRNGGKAFNISKFSDAKGVNDFFNFWGKVAVDPYRKQSTLSKVAGGVLQVAAVALPVMQYFNAVEAGGNAALTIGKQGGDEKLAERVMLPAYEAQEAADALAANNALAQQMKALQALAPASSAPPAFTAQIVGSKIQPTAKPSGIPPAVLFAAVAGGVLLLGALRR